MADRVRIPPRGLLATESEVRQEPFGWTVTVTIRGLGGGLAADPDGARALAFLHLATRLRRIGRDPIEMVRTMPRGFEEKP